MRTPSATRRRRTERPGRATTFASLAFGALAVAVTLTAASALGTAAPACAQDAPEEATKDPTLPVLRIRVTDFEGVPVAGASVRVLDGDEVVAEATTDETGDLAVEGLPRRNLTLAAAADGRHPARGTLHAGDLGRPADPDGGAVGFVGDWTPRPGPGGRTPSVSVVLPALTEVAVRGAPPGARVVGLALSSPLEIRNMEGARMVAHVQGEEALVARTESVADAEGRCSLTGVPCETTLVVRAEKAGTATRAVAVQVGSDRDVKASIGTAEPAWTLAGVVRGADGKPVAGATVAAAPADAPRALADPTRPPESSGRDEADVALAWTATTDAEGRYAIPHLLRGESYAVRAGTPDGLGSAVAWDVAAGDGTEPVAVDLVAVRRVALIGVLKDSDGNHPRRARVRVRSHPRDDGDGRAVQADGGTFTVEGLVPGKYLLGADGEGFLETTREIDVLPDAGGIGIVTVDAGAVISGRVVDLEGKPVAGATVQAFDPDAEATQVIRYPFGEQSTASSEDGAFRLAGLTERTWNVRVRAGDALASIVAPTTAPAADLVLRIGPRPRLRFGVKLPEGLTLRKIQLGVFRLVGDGTPYRAGEWDREAVTETVAAFMDLPADEDVIVRFVVSGHPPYMQTLRLAPGEVRDLGVLEPPEPQVLEGVVRDSSGKPVAGAEVRVEYGAEEEVVTDADGRFRLESVASGSRRILVGKLDFPYVGTGEAEVAVPSPDPVVVTILRHPEVKGRVVGAAGQAVQARVVFDAIRPWGRLERPDDASTDAAGEFSVLLEPGRYRVYVMTRGSERPAAAREVEIVESPEEPLVLEVPAKP